MEGDLDKKNKLLSLFMDSESELVKAKLAYSDAKNDGSALLIPVLISEGSANVTDTGYDFNILEHYADSERNSAESSNSKSSDEYMSIEKKKSSDIEQKMFYPSVSGNARSYGTETLASETDNKKK